MDVLRSDGTTGQHRIEPFEASVIWSYFGSSVAPVVPQQRTRVYKYGMNTSGMPARPKRANGKCNVEVVGVLLTE